MIVGAPLVKVRGKFHTTLIFTLILIRLGVRLTWSMIIWVYIPLNYSISLGDQYSVCVVKLWRALKLNSNDFTLYLIISKWLRTQNCSWKRKKWQKKRLKQNKRRICPLKCFHSFKYVIYHAYAFFSSMLIVYSTLLCVILHVFCSGS